MPVLLSGSAAPRCCGLLPAVLNRVPVFSGLLALVFLLAVLPAQAQYTAHDRPDSSTVKTTPTQTPSESWTKKLRYGGGLSGGFQTNSGYLMVSPTITYMATERFMPGAGATYIYSSGTYYMAGSSLTGKVSTQAVGGNVFARYVVYQNFFAMAEYEVLGVSYTTKTANYASETKNVTLFNPYLGAGTSVVLGGRSRAYASILYNLNYKPAYSPYGQPYILSVGFAF